MAPIAKHDVFQSINKPMKRTLPVNPMPGIYRPIPLSTFSSVY
jgi:hypothetical protein